MRCLGTLLLLVLALAFSGCCKLHQPPQPERPKAIRGWKNVQVYNFQSVGELLLKESESSDNGELGVTIIKITPENPCAEPGSYASMAKVTIRFYRPVDGETLCEPTFTSGGFVMGQPPYCDSKVGLETISIEGINTKEKWVWFDLRK
jgi:hypothetical protein